MNTPLNEEFFASNRDFLSYLCDKFVYRELVKQELGVYAKIKEFSK
jgi:hypothetical protein